MAVAPRMLPAGVVGAGVNVESTLVQLESIGSAQSKHPRIVAFSPTVRARQGRSVERSVLHAAEAPRCVALFPPRPVERPADRRTTWSRCTASDGSFPRESARRRTSAPSNRFAKRRGEPFAARRPRPPKPAEPSSRGSVCACRSATRLSIASPSALTWPPDA